MSDEKSDPPAEKQPPSWEHKTEFEINRRLKDIVVKAIDASGAEVERLKRQLDRLTYGS